MHFNHGITRIPTSGTLAFVVLLAGSAAADYDAWDGHRDIILNTSATGANVAADVHDFPVLIRLGSNESDILAEADGGSSIRFSKDDDATPLPYQIESWSATAAAIWVKVDTVYGNNATQKIRMHWDNAAAADESDGAAVFDTANGFRGVWHLGPDSTLSRDATANQNHASRQGAATATTGAVGGARRFNASGSGDIDTVGINPTFDMSAKDRLTVSAWVRREAGNAAGSPFEGIAGVFDWNSNGTGVNNRMYSLVHNANNGFSFHVSSTGGDGANEVIVNSNVVAEAAWTHAAATADSATITLYVNGVAAGQAAYTGNIYFPADLTGVGPFTIGMLDDNGSGEGQYFNGGIDEVRLSGVARSAAWMKLSYENQKVANSLADIGQPSAPGAPTAVAGVPGAVNSGRVTVSWTAPADDGGAPVTGYKAMAADVADSAKSCTTTGALTCVISGLSSGARHAFVVRAYNVVGGGALSAPSDTVTAPLPVLGGGALMLNVGSFNGAYSFRLDDRLAGTTERLVMNILDVSGKTVWSRSVIPALSGRTIAWNGTTATGARASAGLYFVRVFTVTPSGTLEAVRGGVSLGR